jgi:glutathione peroxidase
MTTLHDFTLDGLDGQPIRFERFRGGPVLLVNVASQCGLTPQYQALEALWRQNKRRGLSVVGLPCNQFGAQEPGTPLEIQSFCSVNYDISFPMTAKIEVNGPGRHPLYRWLAGEDSPFAGDIRWNFEKFLCDGEGRLVMRFSPQVTPEAPELRAAVEQLLKD